MNEALQRCTSCSQRHHQANQTHHLQPNPSGREPHNLGLRYIHLHREINRQGPERNASDEPHEAVEEREGHGYDCSDNNIHCPASYPRYTEGARTQQGNIGAAVGAKETLIRPPLLAPAFSKLEDWLAENLHKLIFNRDDEIYIFNIY